MAARDASARFAALAAMLLAATPLAAGPAADAAQDEPGGSMVILRVAVPETTPAGDTIYLAADFQGWNPGDPRYALRRAADGRWTIALELRPGASVEFKFTRGDWARVEKGARGEELANWVLVPGDDVEHHDLTVAVWADQVAAPPRPSTVVGHVESFVHPPFLDGRRVWVYLPPGYAESDARYPVLYMHDGQNLFDERTSFAGEWQVDEHCERMIAAGEIPLLIVVGVENGGERRVHEYAPWADGRGGGDGDAYLRALRDVLLPEVNRRYRTRTGPAHTWTAGSSLGGLISAYAGWAFAETFGRVAAVSPVYFWAGHRMLAFARAHGRPPTLERFYQDMGSAERLGGGADRTSADDLVADLEAMRAIAVAQGFVEGADLRTVVGEGHGHHERYWSERLPRILRFLAGPLPSR